MHKQDILLLFSMFFLIYLDVFQLFTKVFFALLFLFPPCVDSALTSFICRLITSLNMSCLFTYYIPEEKGWQICLTVLWKKQTLFQVPKEYMLKSKHMCVFDADTVKCLFGMDVDHKYFFVL